MKPITRRTAVSALGLAVPLARARESASAFALIGDRYHNSDYIRTALGKTLGGLGLKIEYSDNVESLNSEHLEGRRLLIML